MSSFWQWGCSIWKNTLWSFDRSNVWPILTSPMPNLHVSHIGVVPEADGSAFSINEHKDPQYTTVTYTLFDTVVHTISTQDPRALLAKLDNLPRGLWTSRNEAYYIDTCLPIGCSISCKIFETVSAFLEWAVKFKTQHDTVHYYLDDFIFISKSNSDIFSTLIFLIFINISRFKRCSFQSMRKFQNVVYGNFALQQTLKVTEW